METLGIKVEEKATWIQKVGILLMVFSSIISAEVVVAIQALLILLVFKKVSIPKKVFVIGCVLFVHSAINIFLENSTVLLFSKQVIGISVSFLFYYTITKQSFMAMVRFYLFVAKLIAGFAIIQQVAFILKIKPIYDMRWILKSQNGITSTDYSSVAIFTEPSYCVYFLMAAVFIAVYRLIGRYKSLVKDIMNVSEAVILIVGFLFTKSSIGFIGLFFSFALIWLEYKRTIKQVVIALVSIATAVFLYFSVDKFKTRLDDMLSLFLSDSLKNINLSVQTLYVNAMVVWRNFCGTLGFGSGLGSNILAYEKYVVTLDTSSVYALLNSADANSLFLRIMSELGVIGLVGIVYYIIKFFSKNVNSLYYVVNRMCLVVFCVNLLRSGHYFHQGIWLFIVLYFFSYVAAKKREEKINKHLPLVK